MNETSWLTKPRLSQGQQLTQTAVRRDIKVPNGHIIVSDKWRGSQLAENLKGQTSLKYDSQLGVVDFHLPGNLVSVYISEGDLVAGGSYKQRLAKFKNGKSGQGVVLVEVSKPSEQYFQDVQKFIVMNLHLDLVTVSSQKDAATALAHLVMCRSQQSSNPFLEKRRRPPPEFTVSKALQKIPNMGPTKVATLIQSFPDLPSISSASVEKLSEFVSFGDAQKVHNFFQQTSR